MPKNFQFARITGETRGHRVDALTWTVSYDLLYPIRLFAMVTAAHIRSSRTSAYFGPDANDR